MNAKQETTIEKILVKNGYVSVPNSGDNKHRNIGTNVMLMTILNNVITYGYILNKDVVDYLATYTDESLVKFWNRLEPILMAVTSKDMNIGDAVVYKNFPKEVLDMSECEYWFNQIFMYFGVPKDFFAEEPKERESCLEKLPLKVLKPSDSGTIQNIISKLYTLPARWTDDEKKQVEALVTFLKTAGNVNTIKFKENLVLILCILKEQNMFPDVVISPTDVLRFVFGFSGGDATLKTKTTITKLNRSMRRFILGMLDTHKADKLLENFAANEERWKRVFERIHVGEYAIQYPNVALAHASFYAGDGQTRNSKIEDYIKTKNPEVFNVLSGGEFMRRLIHLYRVFGKVAFVEFAKNLDKLTIFQLAKTKQLIITETNRKTRMIAPKGNWSKVKIFPNTNILDGHIVQRLVNCIDNAIANRLDGTNFVLDEAADNVKLRNNDSDLLPYGRGTVFPIPKNINFLRSASHWKNPSTCWFDNGWNFFDENWKSKGTCCWDRNPTGGRTGQYAVFSGDPVNGTMANGEGAQLIDIYIDRCVANGIRYGVWNILCFSRKPFSAVPFVHASLQWGEKAQAKALFSPDRCIFNFPVTGENLTKYVAVVDFVERKLIYIDANLKGNVRSASANESTLETTMPAYMEYIESIPSLKTVFETVSIDKNDLDEGEDFVYIGQSDADISLNGQRAWVLNPTNADNSYEEFNVNEILNK